MLDPGTQSLIQNYGLLGLIFFLFGDKILYALTRRKNTQVTDQTTQSIAAMSQALINLNRRFEGVNFQRMGEEVHWLKETHSSVDPTTGTLRFYDKTGELKEAIKDLREEISELSSAIRAETTTAKKLKESVGALDEKMEKIISVR